jgi:tRNA pseudouridine55 synthase
VVLPLYKPAGPTPLQALERLRHHAGLGSEKLTYAGRLDPLAEGVMLILGGEDRYRKEQYTGLDKTYEAEFLIGWGSDTGDVLGRIHRARPGEGRVEDAVRSLEGERERRVPAWASVPVDGKSLVWYQLQGQPVQPPLRPMRVDQALLRGERRVDADTLHRCIIQKISLVHGSFRQTEALTDWASCLSEPDQGRLIHVSCITGPGTYVRSLAAELGAFLGTEALLFSLCRSRVGRWAAADCIHLPTEQGLEGAAPTG